MRTNPRNRERCQLDFVNWDRDAKKEKALWLRKREVLSMQRKELMKKSGVSSLELRQREAAALATKLGGFDPGAQVPLLAS
jgi:hypothetical protein